MGRIAYRRLFFAACILAGGLLSFPSRCLGDDTLAQPAAGQSLAPTNQQTNSAAVSQSATDSAANGTLRSTDVSPGSNILASPAETAAAVEASSPAAPSVVPQTLTQPAVNQTVVRSRFHHVQLAQVPAMMSAAPAATAVPQRGSVRTTRGGGFFARLFGGITEPINSGLNDAYSGLNNASQGLNNATQGLNGTTQGLYSTTEGLNNTSESLRNLQQPLSSVAQPLIDLRQPLQGLNAPVQSLSQSAGSLGKPISGLSHDIVELRQPLSGLQRPLKGIERPLQQLPGPLTNLVSPLQGLQEPLRGLQGPLNGLARPLDNLQAEMHDLRRQLLNLQQTILDIGRNVTLAIVFGSSVIAYAIWTHRKVPSVVQPTIATVEVEQALATGSAEDHPARTIIKTEPVHPVHGAAHPHAPHDVPPPHDSPPPPPPPTTMQLPPE